MGAAGYLGSSVSLRLASAGSAVAIPILAVQQLDDIALGGALVAVSLAPSIISAPLAGVALDRSRHPRRLVLGGALVTTAGFVAVSLLGVLPLPLIVLLLACAGATTPFYFGGLSSFVTDEIPDERRAYALDALSYNISSVAGPGIVAVASLSRIPSLPMTLMAAFSFVGALSALGLGFRARPLVDERVLRTVATGLRHLVTHRPLSVVVASGAVAQFGGGALPIAAIALSLERAGTPDDAAIVVTAFAVGGLLGALIGSVRPSARVAPQVAMGGGFAIIGLLTLAAVPDLGFVVAVIALGLSGVLTASSSAAMLLLRKQQSPLGVRSQVFTIGSGLRAVTGGLGAAVAGLLAGLDAGVLLAGIGAVWVVSGAMMLGYPRGAGVVEDAAG